MIQQKALNVSHDKLFSLIKLSKNDKIRVYKLVRDVIKIITVNKRQIDGFLLLLLVISCSFGIAFVLYSLMMGFFKTVIFLGGLTVCK